jgi:NitT/TauT family transport system substrate-binding protein/sulfonate transport system substrate-binding protein
MFSRRSILALLPTALAAGTLATLGATPTTAQPARKLRVGFQKGEPTLVAAKQNRSLETALAPLGVEVEWLEFPFGPPMLEAMRVGSVDFGGVGDTPPIFAQAAHADLLYVAASPSGTAALLLPPGSKLQTLHDLKGKKLAFARGSSAHNLAVAAVEKADLAWTDIVPVPLVPADAAAAFEHGSIDAWVIWDPYYALYETRPGVRVLATSADIVAQNSFYIASRAFVTANPAVTARTIDTLTTVAAWSRDHRNELAALLAVGTGVPVDVELRAVQRSPLKILPMNDAFADSQQQEADRFHALGLIPTAINVRTQVWRVGA